MTDIRDNPPSLPEPQAQAEPCPNSRSDEFACKNRHQCWEPCGELGRSAEHARPANAETTRAIDEALGLPQAQAGEPEDDLTVAYMCGVEAGKDHMREAIAKKDAALKACVEAVSTLLSLHDNEVFTADAWSQSMDEAREVITQAQEARK